MSDPVLPLGDLLRALALLQPTPGAQAEVARSLGWRLGAAVEPREGPTDSGGGDPGGTEARVAPEPEEARARQPPATPLLLEPTTPPPLDEDLPDDTEGALLAGPEGLPTPDLLQPRWQRALLTAVVRRPTGRGAIDLPALVERLVGRPPVQHLPRHSRPSTRLGVQVLVDRSPSMAPFREDQERLVADLAAVVPAARIQVGHFTGTPLSGPVRWQGRPRAPYVPPPPGTAVLLLSDLGLGPLPEAGRAPEAWLALADRLASAGCRATALVPVAPERWPPALRRAFGLVCWDRSTTASQAHRAGLGAG